MNSIDFKRFLFKIAFSVIVIDGEIHDDEIEELKLIDTKTTYFSDTDLTGELDNLIKMFKTDGTVIVENILNSIRDLNLNQVQELLTLEVALRIIHADNRLDESEKKFLILLRSKLKVADELIRKRFGNITILKSEETNIVDTFNAQEEFKKLSKIGNEGFESLKLIEFSIPDNTDDNS
jgi:uncharacterized tellurite resistance protein B-like protein